MHPLLDQLISKKPEQFYETLLQLGASLTPLAQKYHNTENRVFGCQSLVYLRSYTQEDLVLFEGYSDALITKGILQLLTTLYSNRPAEQIIKASLSDLSSLEIPQILTPSRANGMQAIFHRMQKKALLHLTYH